DVLEYLPVLAVCDAGRGTGRRDPAVVTPHGGYLEVCCEFAGKLVQVLESGEITTACRRSQHKTGCNCEYVYSIPHDTLCEQIHCGAAVLLPATCHRLWRLLHTGQSVARQAPGHDPAPRRPAPS